MDPVIQFQFPAEDRTRMRAFYESVFGWQTHELGPEMGSYVLVTTTPVDPTMVPIKPGEINGGFFQKTGGMMGQHPSVVIRVEDIRETLKKVEARGGQLSGDVQELPGVGLFAAFMDSEGNHISLLQPMAQPAAE